MSLRKRTAAWVFTVVALACVLILAPDARADRFADLVRCADTSYGGTCGGDDLTTGLTGVLKGGRLDGMVFFYLKDAAPEPFTLYEVYWLTVGQSVTNATYVGNFATGCNHGTTPVAVLREVSAAVDVWRGALVDIVSLVGSSDAGTFLVYSRGPYAQDLNGDCFPDVFNTVNSPEDPDFHAELANPPVDLSVDGIQFLSGFKQ